MDEADSSAKCCSSAENDDSEGPFILDAVEVVEESCSEGETVPGASDENELIEKNASRTSKQDLIHRHKNRSKNANLLICAVCERGFSGKVAIGSHLRRAHRFGYTKSRTEEPALRVGKFKSKSIGVENVQSDIESDDVKSARKKLKRNDYDEKNKSQIDLAANLTNDVQLKHRLKAQESFPHNLRSQRLRQNYLRNVLRSVTKFPVETKDDPSTYTHCERRFAKKLAFIEHLQKNRGEKKDVRRKIIKKFECGLCGKKFSQKYNLVVHLKTIHKQTFIDSRVDKPFLCTRCGKRFAQKFSLKTHVQSIHRDLNFETRKEKNFPCFVCNKRFSQNYNLKVHLQTIHKLTNVQPKKEKPFVCSICAKRFGRKHTLKVHFETIHGQELEPKKVKNFACPTCKKLFSRKPNLLRHSAKMHPDSTNLECLTCGKKFLTEEEIRIHVEKCSRRQALENLRRERSVNRVILQTVVCALCKLTLHKVADMRRHYQNDHQLDMTLQTLNFNSEEEFAAWKYDEETTNRCSYSRYRSYQIQKAKYVDFFCSRSGFYKDKNQGLRGRRAIGSKKINACCPAQIKVKYADDKICVKYLRTHVGHDNKLCYMNLTKVERELILDELRKGMAPQEILQKVKYPLPASEDERRKIHLLTVQDIRNIAVTAGIDYKKGRCREQKAVNVATWVDEHFQSVLYYKCVGQVDENFPSLKKDDFLLIIMTEKQKQKLEKLGDNVVLVDSAHAFEKNDYTMTTLMVLDCDDESYPCCFMFSNRIGETFLSVFYQCIKANMSTPLQPQTFVSSVQDAYYTMWLKSFPKPKCRLFSPWHVLKNWRDNLNKISLNNVVENVDVRPENLKTLKNQVYKFLKFDLLEQRDEQTFLNELNTFLGIDNPALRSFQNFFKQSYYPRKEMWAYCYRDEAGIKPNAFNESFQKILKYQHATGSKVRQLDQALAAVVSYLEKKDEAEIMREEKGAQDLQRLRTLRRRHINSLKGDKMSIMAVGDNEWIVPSGSSKTDELCEAYYIRKRDNNCVNCYLMCRECGVCLHDFECTCTDYCVFKNMCKHIHLLCQSEEVAAFDVEHVNEVSPLDGVEEVELDDELKDEEVEYEIVNADMEPIKEELFEEEVISPEEKSVLVKEEFNKVISCISSPQVLNVAKKWVEQFSSIISACEKQNSGVAEKQDSIDKNDEEKFEPTD